MSRTLYVFVFIIALMFFHLNAQEITLKNWQVHTSMFSVQTADADSKHRLWIGSTGGVAIFDMQTQDTILLNHINGLLSSNISVIKLDSTINTMFVGTVDGVIELIHEDLDTIRHITSIRDHGFLNPTINDIVLNNNKAYIGGNFGLTEFDVNELVFTSTVETIGNFPKNTAVNNIIISNDTMWVATPLGIACISMNQKLSVPYNWVTFQYPILKTYNNTKIVKLRDTIFVNLIKGIYTLNSGIYTEYFATDSENYNDIVDIGVYNDQLLFSTAYYLAYASNPNKSIFSNWKTISNGFQILSIPEVAIVYFYENIGSDVIYKDKTTVSLAPNSPRSNDFLNLTVANNGNVYGVTDNCLARNIGGGVMGFDGTKWINYNKLNSHDSQIHQNERFSSITTDFKNRIFGSSWGSGLYIIDENSNNKYTILNDTNSPMTAFSGHFTIAGQVAFDNKGRTWVVNYGENTYGTLLFSFDENFSDFVSFENPYEKKDRSYFNLAIDNYGTKWICGDREKAQGIIYFNDKGTPTNKSDDIWGQISPTAYPNLLSRSINCCVVDNYSSENAIIFGTDLGASQIFDTYPAYTGSGKFIINKISLLNGQNIHNIMIDAVGNKWFATSSGIIVLNAALDSIITTFNKSNSPLISDEVFSLATNKNNGLIYIGTKDGLYITQSTIITPNKDFDITIYPQPFNIDKDLQLTINGLVASSEVKIITPDGMLIRTFINDSKQLIWDGKDNNGNKVSPGVYIVIGNSSVTKNSAAGKIAVIE